MTDVAQQSQNSYLTRENARHFAVLVILLGLLAWNGLSADLENRLGAWYRTIALMAAFAIFLGYAFTGRWRGILIDDRNKISLSRLQILIWSLVVLSSVFTAILVNTGVDGLADPLSISVPQELWILMGISTASAVGSPLILASRSTVTADDTEKTKTLEDLKNQGQTEAQTVKNSVVVRNETPDAARWSDLMKGDEIGGAAAVDVGKLQMFFFTFVLALGYCSAIGTLFEGTSAVSALPAVENGMNVLLGISQTGYLALKASPSKAQANAQSGD